MKDLKCDMEKNCGEPVTHIDEKGFVYCKEHGQTRRNYCYCRALRGWELTVLRSGKPLPSYEPITLTEYQHRQTAIA